MTLERLLIKARGFEEVLKNRGWRVEVVTDPKTEGLVAVTGGALVDCMDGRKRRGISLALGRGPKIQGGVLGVAELLGLPIREACKRVLETGLVPAVHGHCGFAEIHGIEVVKATEIVNSAGGEYVEVLGEHAEEYLRVNLVSEMTAVPNGKAFHVDLWWADRVGIDRQEMLVNAAKTIETLQGPKVARVVV